jgi:hypothetical protein
MDARAAVILLLSTPHVTNYDVLERNVVLNEDGGVVREQYICWDWDHDAGVHRCQGWWRDSGERVQRTADGWRVKVGGVVIESRTFRATRTDTDPELRDREAWPVERRRRVRHGS